MTAPTEVLDAAFDRLGRWGFDDPDGYVNHGPMACEALDALGRTAEVDSWSRLDSGTPPTVPVTRNRFDWEQSLGDPSRTAEWMGLFDRAIADEGWPNVLDEWLPRLLPGMGVALFHGTIRCAHATRAIETVDSPARRAELARSLGYWAGLFGQDVAPDTAGTRSVDDIELAVIEAAADGSRHYLARPNIINLHGVTAAMAVAILVRHIGPQPGVAALAQLRGEHRVLYDGSTPVVDVEVPDVSDSMVIEAAVISGEAHAVKLVEASRRGFSATADPAFLAAAEHVSRRGLRKLRNQDS